VSRYGIVDGKMIHDRLFNVSGLVEKPRIEDAPSNIAIMGRYILSPKIFAILENQQPGAGGEIQLTDAIATLNKQEVVYAYDFEGTRYDVGEKLGFIKTTIEMALNNDGMKDELMDYLEALLRERIESVNY
jgi:UTP--glucose-1-phosphate uridylyltransferase